MIRRLAWPLIAIALLVAAATTAPTTRSHTSKPDRAALPPLPPLPELPHASMLVDSARSEIVLELPPTDIPAAGMVRLPVFQAVMPVSGSISHFHMEVVDPSGRRLPQAMLHHFNLSDPERRELFLPIGLHIMAASKETPAATVPRLLFGLPLERGQRLIASGMLGNETAALQRGVRVRLVLGYVPASRPWPLFRAYPWVMDVQFPLGRRPGGSKAFDLPPGRTERHWESSPAVPGTILGMGGHLHDHGVSLEVKDVTTGEILWHVEPVKDARDQVTSIPLVLFYRWYRLGIHITPRHTYRLTAVYENPTGRVLRDGGMGAVAGLFVPDRGATWPAVDPADSVYRADLHDTLWQTAEEMMGGMKMHGDH